MMLGRIASHLTVAHRLRGARTSAEATLDPSGKVLEAKSDELVRDSGAKASGRRALDRPCEAPCRHRSGRRSLVLEGDGRREVDAGGALRRRRQTCPRRSGQRARDGRRPGPDPIQQKVVALVGIGKPSKLVAYELGISEGSVSRHLAASLAKLGVRSRAELVALYTSLAASSS